MKASSQSILCDPELMDVRDSHFRRLETLFADEHPQRPFFLQGVGGSAHSDPYTQPERWLDESLESLAERAQEARCRDVFRPLCLEFGAYNVHFTARIFGARVHETDGIWWADPIDAEIGQLSTLDLEADETWLLARSVATAFVAHEVTVPLFGMPVIAGALTVAVSIYGARFLETMLTNPSAAEHDLRIINDVTCRLYQWYYDHVPAQQLQQVGSASRCMPPGHVSIYGCSSHLISEELYRDDVAPLDEAVLSTSASGGLIHLCGEHRQHIAAWRAMKSLRAVQLNDRASADLEHYFTGLRDDQVIYLNPTATMTVEGALAITGGKRIVIVSNGRTQPHPAYCRWRA